MPVQPDTRAQLIEATIAALTYGGEGSVRISAIANAVGVREPSVYHFFKNREALIEAAQIERYRRSYIEMMVPFEVAAQMADSSEEFEKSIRKILSMTYSPERTEIRSVRGNVLGAAQSSPNIAEAVNHINFEAASSLARVMEYGQKRGWITTELDAMALAYWGIGQINGRVLVEMNPTAVDLEAWNKVSIEAVLAVYRFKSSEDR
jgi:AcrR family transcriptional regulator